MKDARGHGSDARTGRVAHQAGTNSFKVQRLNPELIGTPWETALRVSGARPINQGGAGGSVRPEAKAERIAQNMRADARGLHSLIRGNTPNPTRVR